MERVPVLVDTFASPSEIGALEGALSRVGLETEVERTVPPQGLAPWLVLIGVPVGQFLAGFFGAAGKDGWEAFKQFFDEIKLSRTKASVLAAAECAPTGRVGDSAEHRNAPGHGVLRTCRRDDGMDQHWRHGNLADASCEFP
jgi:hypothetical protein